MHKNCQRTWHAVFYVDGYWLRHDAFCRVQIPSARVDAHHRQRLLVRNRRRTRCSVVQRQIMLLRLQAQSFRNRSHNHSRPDLATPAGQLLNYCPQTYLHRIHIYFNTAYFELLEIKGWISHQLFSRHKTQKLRIHWASVIRLTLPNLVVPVSHL